MTSSGPLIGRWSTSAIVLGILWLDPSSALGQAQIGRSVPPPGAETHSTSIADYDIFLLQLPAGARTTNQSPFPPAPARQICPSSHRSQHETSPPESAPNVQNPPAYSKLEGVSKVSGGGSTPCR